MWKKTITNVGSINVDHVYRVPYFVQPGETLSTSSYQRVLGGKGANQSIALARAGEPVQHVGAIADDHPWILPEMAAAGVGIDHILMTTTVTGHAMIQVDENAENCILIYPGANHEFPLEKLCKLFDQLQSDNWVLFQNEMPYLNDMIVLAKSRQAKIAINPAPFDETAKALSYDLVDLLILNEIEAAELAKALFDGDQNRLATLCPMVVITRGTQGAVCYTQGQRISVPAYSVNAVDTTGAGDTFVGYLLSSITSGLDIEAAMQRASAASALAVTRVGASVAIPSSKEVAEFLKQQ